METYQKEFIEFLLQSKALIFGDFTLKSGRKAPYFMNTGKFDTGAKISKLGGFYAQHLVNLGIVNKIDIVFGPAYKGIPLAVATAQALFVNHQVDIGYSFNRKEAKDHGDRGVIVGSPIVDGSRIVILEDVITAGITLNQTMAFLNELAKIVLTGVVISVDRCEKGAGNKSAVAELSENYGLSIYPIVTVYDVLDYLRISSSIGCSIPADTIENVTKYLEQFGAA